MVAFKVSIILSVVLINGALAWGGNHGQNDEGYGARNPMAERFQKNQKYEQQNLKNPMNSNRRQFEEMDLRKYRSNLYSDDDIYGYDATYPNGEASYINYKSKEARGRRGPEFKKISRAYSHGQGGGQNGYGRESGFMSGRAHSAGSHSQNYGEKY